MDASRFDAWTRDLGTRSGRRALLRGIVGSAVALGAVSVVSERTEAKKKKCDKKTKQKCAKHGLDCEKGKCVITCNSRESQCLDNGVIRICGGPEDFCVCSRLAEGGFTCAGQLDGAEACPVSSECKKSSDCGTGEVCIDASGSDCCNQPTFGVCVKKCKNGSPGPL
jgi:hypothetical protein